MPRSLLNFAPAHDDFFVQRRAQIYLSVFGLTNKRRKSAIEMFDESLAAVSSQFDRSDYRENLFVAKRQAAVHGGLNDRISGVLGYKVFERLADRLIPCFDEEMQITD